MSNEHSGEQTERTRDQGRSIAEWTTLAISLAIVLGVVGLASLIGMVLNYRAAKASA